VRGRWWDPYNQNVLKGDYPIFGQRYFLNVSAISDSLLELLTTEFPAAEQRSSSGRSRERGFLRQPAIRCS